MNLEALQYPVGRFSKPAVITNDFLTKCIAIISAFPLILRAETAHLSNEQLNTRYRPEGWNIRQVVHHCADSHMNSFTRLKLALTEDNPVIKSYLEDRWAELYDSAAMPVEPALKMLEGIHERGQASSNRSQHRNGVVHLFIHKVERLIF